MSSEKVEGFVRVVSSYEAIVASIGSVVSRNVIFGKIDIHSIEKAISKVFQDHLALQCVFSEQDGVLSFKQLKNIPLPLEIKYGVKGRWAKDKIYKKELNTPLDPTEKLWRVLLICEFKETDNISVPAQVEMILTLQHAICDGMSVLKLVKKILNLAKTYSNGADADQACKDSFGEKSPEDYMFEWKQKNRIVEPELRVPNGKNNIVSWKKNAILSRKPRIIECLERNFSVELTERIIKTARQAEESVNSILCACMLKAVLKRVFIFFSPARYKVALKCSTDLRRRIDPSPKDENLICFAGDETILCELTRETGMSDLALQIHQNLTERLKKNSGVRRILALIKQPEKPASYIDMTSGVLLALSNVGRIDIPKKYGNIELVKTNYTAVGFIPRILVSVTTFDDMLHYTILYTRPWFKNREIKKINNEFRKNIVHYVKQSSSFNQEIRKSVETVDVLT